MPKFEFVNITGQRFGRLVAVEATGKREYRSVVWRCSCDCGNQVLRAVHALKSAVNDGRTSSCGCFLKEINTGRPSTKKLPVSEAKRRRNTISMKFKRRDIDTLSDWYIRQGLREGLGIANLEITPELMELKREQLRLHRLGKQIKQAIKSPEKT